MIIIMCIYACLTSFRENQRNGIKTFSRKCNSIIKDGKFSGMRVKLTNTQLNKLKFAVRNNTGAILRLNKKKIKR